MEMEVKFAPKEDSFFRLLDLSVCEYQKKGVPFQLEETDPLGKMRITIDSEYPCFVIRSLDEKKFPFSYTRQCADHAVFLFNTERQNWTLHIFEFKLSPDEKKWETICKQFGGAMIRSYAVAGILRISEFSEVHLHCCYLQYKSAKVKPPPGKRAQPDFLKKPVPLDSFYPNLKAINAPIQLLKLDAEQNDGYKGYANIKLGDNGCTIL